MADGSSKSRYVKLKKDQLPIQDITPGELNQPIEVPQDWCLSIIKMVNKLDCMDPLADSLIHMDGKNIF